MGQPCPFAFDSRRFRLYVRRRRLLVDVVGVFALASAWQSFPGAWHKHRYNASQFTDSSQTLAQRRCSRLLSEAKWPVGGVEAAGSVVLKRECSGGCVLATSSVADECVRTIRHVEVASGISAECAVTNGRVPTAVLLMPVMLLKSALPPTAVLPAPSVWLKSAVTPVAVLELPVVLLTWSKWIRIVFSW